MAEWHKPHEAIHVIVGCMLFNLSGVSSCCLVFNVKHKISSLSYKPSRASKPKGCMNLPNTSKFSLKYSPDEVCYALSHFKLLVALNFFHYKNFVVCCWLPEPFRGMGAWRKTMEPQKPGNSPGSGPEVVQRQRVAKE